MSIGAEGNSDTSFSYIFKSTFGKREGTLYVEHRNRDRRASRLLKNSRVIIVFDK